jgi:xanthine dehydrogenase molybdenum-binding subunit
MQEFSVIGKKTPKLDALEKATGKAVYGHDLQVPGMLHGKILRSRLPHARIRNIDVSKAKKIIGVKAVITASDLKNVKGMGFLQDNPILKAGKVRSIRDEIAAVAAIDERIAEEAVAAIEVDYEELPAVFDPEEALREGAVLIHEEKKTNLLPVRIEFSHGDVEKGLRESDFVVESVFRLPFVTHCCMEPGFCLASFDLAGKLTVWSTTQQPFLMLNDLSRILGIPGNKIRVVQPAIGGAFGSKLDTYPHEAIAILLARKTGKPVRVAFNRLDEFIACPTRQPMIIKMTQGCTREGKLKVRIADLLLDNGAYTSWGATTPGVALTSISSLYHVENISFASRSVYTNNFYASAMRGYGNPQATFSIECSLDMLAETAGIDPVELRLKNAVQPNEVTPQGFKITSCAHEECLKTAREKIGWTGSRKAGSNVGIGFASLFHVGGGARIYKSDGCGAIVRIDDFGKITLITGANESGQGSETTMALIVAEVLGADINDITVINSDTDIKPWDVACHASRTTFIGGNAALKAAQDAKRQLLELAAEQLKTSPEKLVLKNGSIFAEDDPAKSMPIARAVRSAHFKAGGKMIVGQYFYDPPNEMVDPKTQVGNLSAAWAFGTQAAKVEVDPETGKVKLLKFVAVHDVGRTIHLLGLEGQIEGGVAMGAGYALSEELVMKKGVPQNPNFLDYKLMTAADMPEVEIHLIETNDPEGPFGAKGIGEAGAICAPPAIANAVADALGIRITDLPITPEKVLKALRAKNPV